MKPRRRTELGLGESPGLAREVGEDADGRGPRVSEEETEERERGWAGPEEKVGPAGKGKQADMGWAVEKKKKRKGEKEMGLLG